MRRDLKPGADPSQRVIDRDESVCGRCSFPVYRLRDPGAEWIHRNGYHDPDHEAVVSTRVDSPGTVPTATALDLLDTAASLFLGEGDGRFAGLGERAQGALAALMVLRGGLVELDRLGVVSPELRERKAHEAEVEAAAVEGWWRG